MIRVQDPSLLSTGPIVPVRVGVAEAAEAALLRAGHAVPAPLPVRALIDTGSGRSIIRPSLARQLRLTPVGVVEFDTPSSSDVSALEYYARFWLDGGASFESKVLEAPLPVPTVDALIGRDILALGVLTYDGPGRQFTFAFGPK